MKIAVKYNLDKYLSMRSSKMERDASQTISSWTAPAGSTDLLLNTNDVGIVKMTKTNHACNPRIVSIQNLPAMPSPAAPGTFTLGPVVTQSGTTSSLTPCIMCSSSPFLDTALPTVAGDEFMNPTPPPAAAAAQTPSSPATPQYPRYCFNCFTVETPQWRKGADGPNTLCNRCGLKYSKQGPAALKAQPAVHHGTYDSFLTTNNPVVHFTVPVNLPAIKTSCSGSPGLSRVHSSVSPADPNSPPSPPMTPQLLPTIAHSDGPNAASLQQPSSSTTGSVSVRKSIRLAAKMKQGAEALTCSNDDIEGFAKGSSLRVKVLRRSCDSWDVCSLATPITKGGRKRSRDDAKAEEEVATPVSGYTKADFNVHTSITSNTGWALPTITANILCDDVFTASRPRKSERVATRQVAMALEALEMMLEEKYTWARWSNTDTDKSYWGTAGAGNEAGHADGAVFTSGAASSVPGGDVEVGGSQPAVTTSTRRIKRRRVAEACEPQGLQGMEEEAAATWAPGSVAMAGACVAEVLSHGLSAHVDDPGDTTGTSAAYVGTDDMDLDVVEILAAMASAASGRGELAGECERELA